MTEHDILVFRDWGPAPAPSRIGTLRARPSRRGELFDFTYGEDALADPAMRGVLLDPNIALVSGPQFPASKQTTFGAFADASPDRWGRTLLARRFERDKRAGTIDAKSRMTESDYLLGVHDLFRSGALRFKRTPNGPFLDDRGERAAPPFVRLRRLEAASRSLERDAANDDPRGDEWLRLLIAPGASLGGARPKASVVDSHGLLWIGKFPSVRDARDVGAWEYLVAVLARRCGLRVADCDLKRFGRHGHTFLVRRFDREPAGGRVHFASAMTLTGHVDGDDASSGASYLEIAEVIISRGSQAKRDLNELWSRIVFNVLVSNADDHLRNHGFLLDPGRGWRLSEAFDVNPVPDATGLSLNIDEHDNAFDIDLVRSVAPYFRVSSADASETVRQFRETISTWRTVATSLGISRSECDDMSPAFEL